MAAPVISPFMFYLIQPGNRRGCCVPGGARAARRARREVARREAAVTQAWQPGSGGPGHRGGWGRGPGRHGRRVMEAGRGAVPLAGRPLSAGLRREGVREGAGAFGGRGRSAAARPDTRPAALMRGGSARTAQGVRAHTSSPLRSVRPRACVAIWCMHYKEVI